MNNQIKIPLLDRKIKKEGAVKLKKREDMVEGDLIPAISDTMFKIILGNKKNICYLLSLFLERDMKEIEDNIVIEDKELNKEKVSEAKRSVDLVVKLDGKHYNIELNNNGSKGALKRNIDYASRIFASKRKSGSSYIYESVIQINLNNFFFEDTDPNEIEHEFSYYSKDHKYQLTDMLTFNFFYLPLIKRKWYNKLELSELEKLLLVLTSERQGDYPELLEENSMLKDIQKEIEIAGFDDEVMYEYDAEVLQEFKEKWRIEEAVEEAIEETNKENAKKMLEDNLSMEKISQYTGLSLEEIRKLSIAK